MDKTLIEKGVYLVLQGIGENPYREGLKDTPARVAKMYEEMLEGIALSNKDIAEKYGKSFSCDTDQMVVVKDIPAFSFCEHHMALMYNMKISVGYIPKGKVIGLSKIPRIVDMCCKRLQLQEKIGEDIASVIEMATGSDDVIVYIEASHSCVNARGIKSHNSKTTTLTRKGKFKDSYELQKQFIALN